MLITKEDSGTFIIPNNGNLTEYQGLYRCYAFNKLGTAMSEEIEFIIPSEWNINVLLWFFQLDLEAMGVSTVFACFRALDLCPLTLLYKCVYVNLGDGVHEK